MPRRRTVVALLVVAAIAVCWNRFRSAVETFRDSGIETCETLPVVVHLVGEHHELVMHDGTSGPLYTVKDKAGAIVAGCVSEDAIMARHPDLISPSLGVIRTLHSSQVGYVH